MPLVKIAGVLTAVGTLLIVLLLCVLPTSFQLLGSTVECGIPAVTGLVGLSGVSDDPLLQDIDQQCRRKSLIRYIASLGVFGVGATAGAIMFFVGSPKPVPTPWPPPPMVWNGQHWVPGPPR